MRRLSASSRRLSFMPALIAALLNTGCGGGGGGGIAFIPDLASRATGVVDGYVFVRPSSTPGLPNPLEVSSEPADPIVYDEVAGATIEVVGTGINGATNSQGRYEIPNVPPGVYTLRASVSTGVGSPRELQIEVRAGAVTSDSLSPLSPSSARVGPYFPVGPSDTWTMRSSGQDSVVSILGTEALEGAGTYKRGVAGSTSYDNYTVTANGLLWHGSQDEVFAPPLVTARGELRRGESVTTNGTARQRVGGATEPVKLESRITEVADVQVPAGTFAACVRLDLRLTRGSGTTARTEQHTWWLARNIGQVSVTSASGTSELVSANVGGHAVP